IHVAPPGRRVTFDGGCFAIGAAHDGAHDHLADVLLTSVAETFREAAVGVVLSSEGDDGVEGLGRIRLAGGLAVCQIPEEAASDSAPRSAIRAGAVDHVMSVDDIPEWLASLARTRVPGEQAAGAVATLEAPLLERVCNALVARTG